MSTYAAAQVERFSASHLITIAVLVLLAIAIGAALYVEFRTPYR